MPTVAARRDGGSIGPVEYYRAAVAIAEGRKAVAQMLPAIRIALAA